MTAATLPRLPSPEGSVGELLERLGNIPASRVRMSPTPGSATVEDLIAVTARTKRPCELIDGTLVEKDIGWRESLLAAWLVTRLNNFVLPRKLGLVTTEAGPYRILTNMVRVPGVAFVSWERIGGRKLPSDAVPRLVPDLAVEILSASNTKSEIERKLDDYFAAGVTLAWIADPDARTVDVYTARHQMTTRGENECLDGGAVLPGFSLPIKEWLGDPANLA